MIGHNVVTSQKRNVYLLELKSGMFMDSYGEDPPQIHNQIHFQIHFQIHIKKQIKSRM